LSQSKEPKLNGVLVNIAINKTEFFFYARKKQHKY